MSGRRAYSFVLDCEALSAAARANRVMQPWLELARRTDSVLYVSALTLAEATDGTADDVRVRRMLKATRVIPVTEPIGYEAGRLRRSATSARRKARDLTVDAVVAATALAIPDPAVVILTGDPDDLSLLTQGTSIAVEPIVSG